MKVFQIWSHDYMDPKPVDELRTFASQEDADKFVEHMRKNWSGGTTSDAKLLTKDEVIALSKTPQWSGYEEAILNLLNECDY